MEDFIMKLFESIDGLLVGTKYLAWAIALICIPMTAVLFFVNLPLGLPSAMVFVAAFLLAVGVTVLLLPEKLAKGKLADQKKRYMIGGVALILAVAIMGITYFANGGFPALNLLFA